MKFLFTKSSTPEEIQAALERPSAKLPDVSPIIEDVRQNGDEALKRLTIRFDRVDPEKVRLRVPPEEIQAALERIDPELRQALEEAILNIEKYHRAMAQLQRSDVVETRPGVRCWNEVRPIESAGLYVPNGLVSSVLMQAVPARIAGVPRIALCTPPNTEGMPSDAILAACALLGIDEVYAVGGAQAIAAMAYGTETIAQVKKITGPGNVYVSSAKATVRNDPEGAETDGIAGPSEVLIIADDTAIPEFVAADLLAQAEHDRLSQVVLLSTSQQIIDQVRVEIAKQLLDLPRMEIAEAALASSCCILVQDIDEAIEISNAYAPEHLILQVENSRDVLRRVMSAGSVFLGSYSAEALGDYCSGTNHALPTLGFSAKGLKSIWAGTYQNGFSAQEVTGEGLRNLAQATCTLADVEGLQAHKEAVLIRLRYLDELARKQ